MALLLYLRFALMSNVHVLNMFLKLFMLKHAMLFA